jgi:hypothetical protein
MDADTSWRSTRSPARPKAVPRCITFRQIGALAMLHLAARRCKLDVVTTICEKGVVSRAIPVLHSVHR